MVTEEEIDLCISDLKASQTSEKQNLKLSLDLGMLPAGSPNLVVVEKIVRMGPPTVPAELPKDGKRAFPRSVLFSKCANGEKISRDWLAWSEIKESLFCFPCRLFGRASDTSQSRCSVLLSDEGWRKEYGWRKLYDKLPPHEQSLFHKRCYANWRELERRINKDSEIHFQLDAAIAKDVKYWRGLLETILKVVLFISERALAFRGDSDKIGDPHNGNFLGMLELVGNFDAPMREHLSKVQDSQENGTRLQAHYLSYTSQNEFVEVCSNRVIEKILEERKASRYFSILVDGTPDASHFDQTTFILRYVFDCESEYKIVERFLCFSRSTGKTGQDIADLIMEELEKYRIPIKDCRGQGYDNGANMAGIYKGAQAIIKAINPFALYSNCGAHSLNLCGVNAAECCSDVITFFGMVQKLYNFFSKSTQRWEILTSTVGCSLHMLSDTRWSARVESVEPFAKHLPLLTAALSTCEKTNLTSECKIELKAIKHYLSSFTCILMSTIWFKVLKAIDFRNKIIQARNATLDVEMDNIESLSNELKTLRNQWENILSEAKLVAKAMASNLPIELELPEKRLKKRKRFHDESEQDDSFEITPAVNESLQERNFRVNCFYALIDTVVVGLTERFQKVKSITDIFKCLWQYLEKDEHELSEASKLLIETYPDDITNDIIDELKFLKPIHQSNLGQEPLKPLHLLNRLRKLKLDSLFPTICIALRLFCTLPVTVAEAERSFSKLNIIKNNLRSTMGQSRLSGLATLSIENELARQLNFDDIINDFAAKKARKKHF